MAMSGETLTYLIELRDGVSAAAEAIAASTKEAAQALLGMGTASETAEANLRTAAAGMQQAFANIDQATLNMQRAVNAPMAAKYGTTTSTLGGGVASDAAFLAGGSRLGLDKGEDGGGGSELGFLKNIQGRVATTFLLHSLRNDIMKRNVEMDEVLRTLRGSIAGATQAQMDGLRDLALDLAEGGILSPPEIAKAFEPLHAQGLPVEQWRSILSKAIKVAEGTRESLEKVVDAQLLVMKNFDLTAKDAGHLADLQAKAYRAGIPATDALTFMYKNAPAAHAFGMSPDELTNWEIALKRSSGLPPGVSGAALTQLMRKLQGVGDNDDDFDKHGKATAKWLHEWIGAGLKYSDIKDPATGQLRSLDQILAAVDRVAHLPGRDTGRLMEELIPGRAYNVMVDPKALRQAFYEAQKEPSAGAADELGAAGLTGLSASRKKVQEAIERLSDALGSSGLNDQVAWLNKSFAGLVDHLSHANPLVRNIGGYLGIIGNAMASMAYPAMMLSFAMPKLSKAMWTFLGPIGLAVAGLLLLAQVTPEQNKAMSQYLGNLQKQIALHNQAAADSAALNAKVAATQGRALYFGSNVPSTTSVGPPSLGERALATPPRVEFDNKIKFDSPDTIRLIITDAAGNLMGQGAIPFSLSDQTSRGPTKASPPSAEVPLGPGGP